MTQTTTGFAPAPPKKEASTSNIGYVIDIGDTYLSTNSSYGYYVTPLTYHGMGAGKEQRVWLVFKPEWFQAGFNPNQLSGQPGKPEEVYRKNVCDDKTLAILQAISGEYFGELCAALSQIPLPEDNEDYCTQVTQTLIDFVSEHKVVFGYVLTQGKAKDTDGNWTLSKYMSVNRYFVADEKNLEKERMRARKTAEKINAAYENKEATIPTAYRVTFDDGAAF